MTNFYSVPDSWQYMNVVPAASATASAAMDHVEGDLFSNTSPDVALAHCVSSDLAMGKGIAVKFRNAFGRVDELEQQPHQIGDVPYLRLENGRLVFYLITKQNYWDKPTYDTLRRALATAKEMFETLGVTKIAIPEIGCGLDRLSWSRVEELVQEQWRDIHVTVYHYKGG